MMDALQAMRFLRNPGIQSGATGLASAPAAAPKFGDLSSKLPTPTTLEKDVFQKANADAGSMPKGGKIVNAANAAPLEKPASGGGLGRFFQALKSRLTPDSTSSALPAPARLSVQTLQDVQTAAQKATTVQAANPFKTMEAILLGNPTALTGGQNLALKTANQFKLDLNKKPPMASIATLALPIAGLGLLAVPVVAPSALAVNPALLNPVVLSLIP